MGNLASSSKKEIGALKIELDHQLVMVGQTLTGKIICQLNQEFPPSKLYIDLLGTETIVCNDQEMFKNKRALIAIKKDVHFFNPYETIKPTTLTFPFSIDIPSDLPSSFFFFGKGYSEISIIYSIKAVMEDLAQDGRVKYQALNNESFIYVSRPPQQVSFNIPVQRDFKIENLLFNKGSSFVQINIGKDFYEPNEILQISTLVDNLQCSSSITDIEIGLNRLITAQSQGGLKFSDKCQLMYRKSEGVKAKSKDIKNIFFPLGQISAYPRDMYSDQFLKSFKDRHPALARDLNYFLTSLQPSVKTPNFQCQYYIEVKFKHGALLGNELPPTVIHFNMFYNSENPWFSQAVIEQMDGKAYINPPTEQQIPNYSGILSFAEAQNLYYECNRRAQLEMLGQANSNENQNPNHIPYGIDNQIPVGMPIVVGSNFEAPQHKNSLSKSQMNQNNNPVVVNGANYPQLQQFAGFPIQYEFHDQLDAENNDIPINPQDMIETQSKNI